MSIERARFCGFWDSVPCPHRKSVAFSIMMRCFNCPEYLRFNNYKIGEEAVHWKAVERDLPYESKVKVSDAESARAAQFLENRLRINRRLGDNPHHYLPYEHAPFPAYVPATFGAVTNKDFCASHHGYTACKNVEGHRGKMFRGEDATDKILIRHKHWWCHSPLCPKCCLNGFACRAARSAEARIKTAEKHGLFCPEHIIVSFLPKCFNIPIPKLKVMALDALAIRGIVGGVIIPHGWRVNESHTRQEYSPHFHTVSYVKNGYDMCRLCDFHTKEDCLVCSGFRGREMRNYAIDKILVSVKDKRESIYGTLWYELHHCLVQVGLKHGSVVSYFGELANRLFKSNSIKVESKCAICNEGMENVFQIGKHYNVKDTGTIGYRPAWLEPEFDDAGDPNYICKGGDTFG